MQRNPSQASNLAMSHGPVVPSQKLEQKNDEVSNRMMVYAESQDIRYRFSLWDVETIALALASIFGFMDIVGCVYAAMIKNNYSTGRLVVYLAHHILDFIGCAGCVIAYSVSVPQIYFLPIFIAFFYTLIYALLAVFWVVVLALKVKSQHDFYCKVVNYDVILGEWLGKLSPVTCKIIPFQMPSDGSELLKEENPAGPVFLSHQMPAFPQQMPALPHQMPSLTQQMPIVPQQMPSLIQQTPSFSQQMPSLPQQVTSLVESIRHAAMLYTVRLYVSMIMVLLLWFGFWLTILYRSYQQSAKEQNDKSLRLPVAEVADSGQDASSQYGYASTQPVYASSNATSQPMYASSNASTVGPYNQ
uniref:Uncharacterized protein n=1 Tax=Ditylenchus dipsaci TaxID=166011 RepID=A0A915EMN5_9BILA